MRGWNFQKRWILSNYDFWWKLRTVEWLVVRGDCESQLICKGVVTVLVKSISRNLFWVEVNFEIWRRRKEKGCFRNNDSFLTKWMRGLFYNTHLLSVERPNEKKRSTLPSDTNFSEKWLSTLSDICSSGIGRPIKFDQRIFRNSFPKCPILF